MHANLSAELIVSDPEITVILDGAGNCIEVEDGVVAIGSGGLYALSAARALVDVEGFTAEQIARKSMKIAADLCIYTNHNITVEVLKKEDENKD